MLVNFHGVTGGRVGNTSMALCDYVELFDSFLDGKHAGKQRYCSKLFIEPLRGSLSLRASSPGLDQL